MILLESIIDGIRDIKDHFGRTMLQLVGIILGAGSIVATFSLSVAGKAASMEYYQRQRRHPEDLDLATSRPARSRSTRRRWPRRD